MGVRLTGVFLAMVMLSMGLVLVVPHRAAAEVSGADSIGIVYYNTFESDFSFTWTSTDCIRGQLAFNGLTAAATNAVCGTVGQFTYSYLVADLAAGTYRLDLFDTTLGYSIYSRSWVTPGVTLSVGATQSSANVGDTVGVRATLALLPGGPDEYYTEGNLTVSTGQPISQNVYPDVMSAHYWSYYGLSNVPQYETFTMVVPMSFSTGGSESIVVSYWDPGYSASGTATVNVNDASATQANAAEQTAGTMTLIAIVALLLAVLGLIFGLLGFRAARSLKAGQVSPAMPPQAPPPAPAGIPYQVPPPAAPQSPEPRPPLPPPPT